MSYIKFEAQHLGEDHWLDVSPAAFVVHTWALSWCNEQNTDGRLSKARAYRLVCPVEPRRMPGAWAELIKIGVWVEDGDEYVCPTFTSHGIAADEQNKTREKWAADKRRQRLHRQGNHELCSPSVCPAAKRESARDNSTLSTRDKVDMSTKDKWTTRPDPTRPDPTPKGEGRGRGDGSGSDGATPDRPAGKVGPPPPEIKAQLENLLGRGKRAP